MPLAPSPRTRRRWRRLARRAAFSLLPTAGLLLLGELAARLAGSGIEVGPTGWTVAPGLVEHLIDQPEPMPDFRVSTNADGLRSAYGRERAPGSQRLLTFGDSTVFGWGLPPEGAPAGVIEAALGADWQAVNAGQPGFSSEQARRLAEAIIPLYRPDAVLWFQPWHDLRGAEASDRELLPAQPPWWAASALLSLLAEPPAAPERRSELMPFAADTVAGGTPRVPPEQRAENIAAVRDLAAAEGAWVAVVLLPADTALARGGTSPYAEEIAGICQSLGLPFIDPSPQVAGLPIASITLPGDTGHFTAEANARLMAPVIDLIRQREGS